MDKIFCVHFEENSKECLYGFGKCKGFYSYTTPCCGVAFLKKEDKKKDESEETEC